MSKTKKRGITIGNPQQKEKIMTDITPDEYRNRRSNRVLAFKTEGDMIKLIAPVAVKPAKAPMTPGSQICVEVPVDFLRALKLNGRTVRAKLGAGALD